MICFIDRDRKHKYILPFQEYFRIRIERNQYFPVNFTPKTFNSMGAQDIKRKPRADTSRPIKASKSSGNFISGLKNSVCRRTKARNLESFGGYQS